MLLLSLHATLHFSSLQIVQGQDFDALPTDEEIVSFLRDLNGEIHSLNDVAVDQMNQPWRTFAALINKSLSGKTSATPPKKAQKFKKPTSPKLTTVLVSTKEPTRKSKRLKRPAEKSTQAPARGVVIRETPKMPFSKEKVDVTRGQGIELLLQVALNEDDQFEEVQKKSMGDFHKTHPSGSGIVTKTALSAAKIKPSGNDEDDSNNNQDTSGEDSDQENNSDDDKTQSDNENESDSEHEMDENESDSKSDQEEDDEEEEEEEVVKTPSNNSDDEDETNITDKAEGDEDEEMDYTTNLAAKFLNILDIPTTEAEIVSPMDVHVHHEVLSKQTTTLLIVPVSVITESSPVYSTVIPQSLPFFTPPPLQSTSTPPPITKATNPPSTLPDFASVFYGTSYYKRRKEEDKNGGRANQEEERVREKRLRKKDVRRQDFTGEEKGKRIPEKRVLMAVVLLCGMSKIVVVFQQTEADRSSSKQGWKVTNATHDWIVTRSVPEYAKKKLTSRRQARDRLVVEWRLAMEGTYVLIQGFRWKDQQSFCYLQVKKLSRKVDDWKKEGHWEEGMIRKLQMLSRMRKMKKDCYKDFKVKVGSQRAIWTTVMTRKEYDGISIALDPQTLSSGFSVSTEWEVVFLGGTTLAEVILVKGHELPTIVKVLPVGFHLSPTSVNT
ncbi:hypothetical protein Tco_1285153 [Tanacetum coccineum]